jgi:hypothetical protein
MKNIDSCFIDRRSKTLDIITVIDLIRDLHPDYNFYVTACAAPKYVLSFKLHGSNHFRKVEISTVKFGHVRYSELLKVLGAIDAPYPDRKVKASQSLIKNFPRWLSHT